MLAIAVAAPVKTDNGAVLFYRLSATGEGSFIKAIRVGALPDMLTFTPDGSKVLVANEGEPDTDYLVDPDNTGVVDKVYAYGARSFSIWDQNVNQV
ncbi:MAG TPA: hypothetical protein VLA40_05465, partial [Rheinheimera sp.]|nr:hypothetical protein [Rheinheimera sp.]